MGSHDSLPHRYSHLVFDCDGVLVDSERLSCAALHQSILAITDGRVSIPHRFPDDFYPVFGMDLRNNILHYRETMKVTEWEDVDDVLLRLTAAKEELYAGLVESTGLKACPGVTALIDHVRELGVPYGVGSSGTPEKIWLNLNRTGIGHLFEPNHVVSAKMVPRGKPAPDVYLEAMRRIGCTEPGRCVVIEDAVNGLKAAKAAGAFALGITNSLPREALEPFADFVVDTLEGLNFLALPPARITPSQ